VSLDSRIVIEGQRLSVMQPSEMKTVGVRSKQDSAQTKRDNCAIKTGQWATHPRAAAEAAA
jgi:hypothetical protein